MPGRIVQDENIALSFQLYVSVGMVEKYLEYLGVRMGKNERIEFTRARAYHSRYILTYVCSFITYADFLTFQGPSTPRPGVAFNAAFVEKPVVDIRIVMIDGKILDEALSLVFVLTVGPGSWNLETESLFMKPFDDRAVANLMGKFILQIAVEFLCCSMGLISLLGVLNKIPVLLGLLFRNSSWSAAPRPLDETVNASFVESSDPPAQGPPAHTENVGHLIVTHTEKERLDSHHTIMAPPRHRSLSSDIEFFQGAVLPIRHGGVI